MTAFDPENKGQTIPTSDVEGLGDTNWRRRKRAVNQLVTETGSQFIDEVVAIVRHSHRDLARLNAALEVLVSTDVDSTGPLIELLSHPDADVRVYVALALGNRGDPRAIPSLVNALSDIDTNVKVHAIEALGKLRAAAAVDKLVQFIESANFEVAFPALDALAAIGDQRVVSQLLPSLHDPLLQLATIEALGYLGDAETVRHLMLHAKDPEAPLTVIAQSIRRLHDSYVSEFGDANPVIAIVRETSEPSFAATLQLAIDSNHAEARSLVWLLGWLPGDGTTKTLLECFDNPLLRSESIEALAARGADVVRPLLERLSTADAQTQFILIELCGRIGAVDCVPMLLQLMDSEDVEIVAASLEACGKIRDPRAYQSALSRLGHSSAPVRQAAVLALNAMQNSSMPNDLHSLICDRDPLVREAAIRVAAHAGLPQFSEQMITACGDGDERVRRAAIEHLGRTDDPRGMERLKYALQSDVASVRAAATEALARFDSHESVALLEAALKDPDAWVRYFAVRSLSQINHCGEMAGHLLAIATSDPAAQVRIAAVELLERYPDQALSVLITLAGHPDRDLAHAALVTLGAARHPDALGTLLFALDSDEEQTRYAAIDALVRRGWPDVIGPLVAVAKERNLRLSEEAIAGLGRLHCVEALLEIAEIPAKRVAVVAALGRIGDDIIPELACRLRGSTLDVRRVVIDVLRRLHSDAAFELLKTALEDPSASVRHSALTTLAHMHGQQGIPHHRQ